MELRRRAEQALAALEDRLKRRRDYFAKVVHPKTGLPPNLSAFDGTPLGFRGPAGAAFREDAWRVAMNWSVDRSWWAKDPREQELRGVDRAAHQLPLQHAPAGVPAPELADAPVLVDVDDRPPGDHHPLAQHPSLLVSLFGSQTRPAYHRLPSISLVSR